MHQLKLESLEPRTLLDAVLSNGVLTITGTDNPDTIAVNPDTNQIIVDLNGTLTPFDANLVNSISIDALGGGDTITVNVNRPTNILGGAGIDNITGSDGGADNVLGGTGNDIFAGRGGNDTFTWNPGDGNDVIDGNAGDDTHIFNGSGGDEIMSVAPSATPNRITLLRNLGNIVMDIGTFENITINALGGSDQVSGAVGLAALLTGLLTFNGDAGNDILNGGDGADRLNGGSEDDTIDGNRGNDTSFMGAGNDTFIWDPGDGSDIVEGEVGFDELQFNGAAAAEIFSVSTLPGGRVLFFRNLGNINMDLNDVERIDLATVGGADQTTVNDTSGTDLQQVNIEFGVPIDGVPSDVDRVIVNGSNNAETATISGSAAAGININGFSAAVNIFQAEPTDELTVNGLGGNDTLNATGLTANAVKLTLDGGDGNDNIHGSPGIDLLLGGANDDFIDGNQANDRSFMGSGNDTFQWDPGDGSDFVEGEAGFDTLLFNGSGGNENFDASANGNRLRFFRNVGNIIMDVGTTEKLDLRALGGNDNTVINNLSGTPVNTVIVDAGAGEDTFIGSSLQETFLGGPDNDLARFGDGDFFDMGAGADEIQFFATNGNDNIHVDAKQRGGNDELFFHGNIGNQLAVFNNGEIVTVFTLGGNDKVKIHNKAADLWDINVVD